MLGGAMLSAASAGKTSGGFEALYDDAVGDVLHGPGQESFEAIKMLKSVRPENYVPASGARYPTTRFGESLKQIAQLVKSDVGVEIAFADLGGWDTHANQSQNGNPSAGTLANKLRELGAGLSALYRDLESRADDVMILTMSEFGRTARQNGTGGTDHGHATCFFALGGKVNGGKVLGDWPTLADVVLATSGGSVRKQVITNVHRLISELHELLSRDGAPAPKDRRVRTLWSRYLKTPAPTAPLLTPALPASSPAHEEE